MGGGDLNLKKSWHPSTMKNIEKVWKAEQQQNQEKKKIAELKKEIEMEKDKEDLKKYAMEQNVIEKKDDKKLDWMYKGPNQLINREEYLLGRPIDKSFEQMAQEEKSTELNHTPRNHVEHECVPPSLRFFSGNEQVDLVRKMQEDPLYAIKKKEMETRNQLLKNPVKLKQLRRLLEQQSERDKNEKKQKKKKKKHRQDEEDSDDETQLDILLAAKYKQLKDKLNDKELMKSMKRMKHKRHKKIRKENDSFSSKSEDSSEESSDNETLVKHKKKERYRNEDNNIQSYRDRKEKYVVKANREEDKKQKIFEKERTRNHNSNNERNSAMVYERKSKTDRRDSYQNENQDFRSRISQEKPNSSRRIGDKYNNRNISDSYVQKKYKEEERNKDKWNLKRKHHLTEEEKERRRQEMLINATWRDKERERNIKKYREEEKKEVDSTKVYNQDFIRKQLVTATEVGTVASRIKANINNIQRSGRAMDTNFAKR